LIPKKKIDSYSFAINSEIINVFLIVSIVIALIFAIITFFLIRRKQSSESTNIEGDNLLKGNEKEENEEKGEQDAENKEEKEEQAE
jgi:flagellar basal body-associated protein FliL